MFLRRYQWVLGVIWLVVATGLLFRDVLLPNAIIERIKTENGWLIVLMAFVFAAWNFARSFAFHQGSKRTEEKAFPDQKPKEKREPELIREFQFEAEPKGGKPSTSTD